MDFLAIPMAGDGLKPWEEKKEGEEEKLEPYLSSGGISDLRFSMNTKRGGHDFQWRKEKESSSNIADGGS